MNSSPFSLDTNFSASDASEDKIDLELSGWEIIGLSPAESGIQNFKHFLSSPPLGQIDLAWPTDDNPATFGWFFLRPAMKGKDRNKLLIRGQALTDKENNRRHEAPLCGGYCLFYLDRKPQPVTGTRFHRAKLTLSLNLQRFIRHQAYKDNPKFLHIPQLQKQGGSRSSYQKECSFDGEDNWIPATPSWNSFSTKDHITNYIRLIHQQIDSEMKRASEFMTKMDILPDDWDEIMFSSLNEDYGLSTVETLWEFPSSNPMMDVIEIGTKLLHLKRASGKVVFNNLNRKIAGRIVNTPYFNIPIAENVALKLYAKTNRRIRFEIVQYNLRKKRHELLHEAGIESDERSWAEIPSLLSALRRRAADHLNQVMKELRSGRNSSIKSYSSVHLLAEISAAVPPNLTATHRLSQIQILILWLFYQRGYRGSLQKSSCPEALHTLVKKGILKFERKRQFYVLSDNYMKAADDLNTVTGEPLLAIFGPDWGGYGLSNNGKSFGRLRED